MPILEGWTGHTVDVAVVGAGAAGLAAARHLQSCRPDLTLLVLEAGTRLGGRACTVLAPTTGEPLDLGCGWLHGARTNAWTRIAGELDMTVDRTPAPWDRGSRDLALSGETDRQAREALQGFFTRLEQARETEPDQPLSVMLEPGNPWNGMMDAIGTYINGAELDRASLNDYVRYDPGPSPDWRLPGGYGTLVRRFGEPAPVLLDTAVTGIDHRGEDTVRVETHRGTLEARAVVVTVATTMLAAEAIRFVPPLPATTEAAGGLPLGLDNKLFLKVDRPDDLPVDGNLMGSARRTETGTYQVRPFGRPIIEGYFGGRFAHDLERAGPEATLAFAKQELAGHFGSAFPQRVTLAAVSAWAGTPHIGGAYSYAVPGAADARQVLAEPVGERLFFAGEACSRHRFSTAHGAYETGIVAAEAVAATLRGPAARRRGE